MSSKNGNSKTTSAMPSGAPSASSKSTRSPLTYLRPSLPTGWVNYFAWKRTGRYYGLAIACTHCPERPPKEVKAWNRWRWLAAHIATKHGNIEERDRFLERKEQEQRRKAA